MEENDDYSFFSKFYKFLIPFTFVVMIVALVCFFSFVAKRTLATERENGFTCISEFDDTSVFDFVDPDTGIHYLIYTSYRKAGMSVRYNSDGSIMKDYHEGV